jgi:hypothetical protein
MLFRHDVTSAAIERMLANGPVVAASNGHAVLANHQSLQQFLLSALCLKKKTQESNDGMKMGKVLRFIIRSRTQVKLPKGCAAMLAIRHRYGVCCR